MKSLLVLALLFCVAYYLLTRGSRRPLEKLRDAVGVDLPQFSDDEISKAALDIVFPLPSCYPSYLNGTVAQCDHAAARVSEMRRKYSDYEPQRMRAAIMQWLDFADRRIREDRDDCVSGESKRRQAAYAEELSRDRRRTQEVRESLRALKSGDPQ